MLEINEFLAEALSQPNITLKGQLQTFSDETTLDYDELFDMLDDDSLAYIKDSDYLKAILLDHLRDKCNDLKDFKKTPSELSFKLNVDGEEILLKFHK